MAQRRIDRDLASAPAEAVLRIALRDHGEQRSSDANEWYWVTRVGHPLVDSLGVREFLNTRWWNPRDLTKGEIATLSGPDLEVLSLSRSSSARLIAAGDKRTPVVALARLTDDTDADIRRAVGHNPATPSELLVKMHRSFLERSGGRRDNDEISEYRLDQLWLDVDDWRFPVDFDMAEEIIRGGYHKDLRGKLAQHPRVPPDLRRRLARQYELSGDVAAILADDPALEVRQALGENFRPEWNDSVAERLAHDDAAEVRSGLARGWGTPQRLLQQLGEDADVDVRIAAGSNWNLPSEARMRLLSDADPEVRRQVILNGAFDYSELVALDAQDELRPSLQERLALGRFDWGDEHTYRKTYVGPRAGAEKAQDLKRAEASKGFLRELARSAHASTRIAVALNTGTPEDALIALADDPEEAVRNAVYEILGIDSTRHYGYYEDPEIWWYRRDYIDAHALARADNPHVRALMATRLGSAPQWIDNDDHLAPTLRDLARDPDPEVRAAVATNPRIAFEDLVQLCDDPDEEVQAAAADEIIKGLTGLESPKKREKGFSFGTDVGWLEDRIGLPQELQEQVNATMKILFDPNGRIMHLGARWGSTWTDWMNLDDYRTFHTSLSEVNNPSVRAAIASFTPPTTDRPSILERGPVPSDVLLRLAQDPVDSVRSAAFTNTSPAALEVARFSNVPTDVLLGYSRSKSDAIRAAVARNAKTPEAALANLVRDPERSVRAAVAGHSKTPEAALANLARDPKRSVRAAVAGNRRTPVKALTELTAESDDDVLAALAGNPSVPPGDLRKIAYSADSKVRLLVASNPNTPADTLEILAQDQEARVRAAAASRLR